MVSQSCTKSWSLNWEFRQYREIKWKAGVEPQKRSRPLIATLAQSQWHVTVTFTSTLDVEYIAAAEAAKKLSGFEISSMTGASQGSASY